MEFFADRGVLSSGNTPADWRAGFNRGDDNQGLTIVLVYLELGLAGCVL